MSPPEFRPISIARALPPACAAPETPPAAPATTGNRDAVLVRGRAPACRVRVWIEALDAALKELRDLDARCHDVVEMRDFGGLALEEIADVLDISLATVKRDWQRARAFLFKSLRSQT